MSAPFGVSVLILTESWNFDIMHRRAGWDAATPRREVGHADAHKYCPLGRCGTRPGPYNAAAKGPVRGRSAKITAWRISKAKANRAYLEEHVYAKASKSAETRNRVVHTRP